MTVRRGSALLMALWAILVLSVIVISFAYEAKLQGGINLYVQGKNQVKRLIESGKILGEVVMINYNDVTEWSDGENLEDLLEDDRWIAEKRDLKSGLKCTIGPIQLDEEREEAGAVTVEITASTQDEQEGGVNINLMYEDVDQSSSVTAERWKAILGMAGIPKEATDDEGKRISLWAYILACWKDYRDDDDTRTDIHNEELGDAEGAEKKEYEEYYDDHKKDFADEDRYAPANGEISDLKELSRVLCFQKFPALLTGGVLNPWEEKKDKQITVSPGLLHLGVFGVSGDGKLNVNTCSVNELMTVPGIYDSEELEYDDFGKSKKEKAQTRAGSLAEAIVKCRDIMPEEYDVDETRTSWPYKDMQDMCQRIEDAFTDAETDEIEDAKEFLTFKPDEGTVFTMKITASLMDMEYSAECECYVKDKKVRYISWKEN